jgi:hypothetical protein
MIQALLVGHDGADRVATDVFSTRIATSVSKEPVMGFIEQTSSRSATEDGPTQRCGSKVGHCVCAYTRSLTRANRYETPTPEDVAKEMRRFPRYELDNSMRLTLGNET